MYERWNAIDTIPCDDTERILEREKESQERHCSTSFIIKDVNEHIWILTCAHLMGHAFKTTHLIIVKEVEQLRFRMREDLARIYCDACVA